MGVETPEAVKRQVDGLGSAVPDLFQVEEIAADVVVGEFERRPVEMAGAERDAQDIVPDRGL